MRVNASTILILVLLAAVPVVAGGDATSYGAGVTLDKAVAIEVLLATPDDYLGKTVRVDGVITGVCEKRGCWMQITDPDTGSGVRVKVEDGVIVFPYTAMGKKASAEGVFDAVVLTPEQVEARKARAAAAQPQGETEGCDKTEPKTEGAGCDAPVQDNRIFMIRGTGAVVHS